MIDDNNTQASARVGPVGSSRDGAVPEDDGACPVRKTEDGWKLSRIDHFRRLDVRRKQPGNCSRCGARLPEERDHSTCARCRAYHRKHKLRLKARAVQTEPGVVKVLAQFRRELSRLRATVKNMASRYRIAYRRGYSAGLAGKRARFRRGAWMPHEMSKQELAEINHAYDHDNENTDS